MRKPYINLTTAYPGFMQLTETYPETGKIIGELLNHIMEPGNGTLPAWFRELIAFRVATLNKCVFMAKAHSACLNYLKDNEFVALVLIGDYTMLNAKYSSLLKLLELVIGNGNNVNEHHIAIAKDAGCTDDEIHDTVLITSVMCMMNRYTDGLGTSLLTDDEGYKELGKTIYGN